MKKLNFIALFIALLSFTPFQTLKASSDDKPLVYKVINDQESLDSLAQRLMPRFERKYDNNLTWFKRDLVRWNKHITNWNHIPKNTSLYVEFPFPVHISHEYAPPFEHGRIINDVSESFETSAENKRFRLFSMFTLSLGNFNQYIDNNLVDIKSTQHSPFSFGLGSNILIPNSKSLVSTSIYWSSLNSSKVTGLEHLGEIKTRPEVGFNVYYQHHFNTGDFGIYGGVDYEEFSSFNLNTLIQDELLYYQRNKLAYATIGLSKLTQVFDKNLMIKASFAKSINSKSNGDLEDYNYDGTRLLLFTSLQGSKNVSYNLLYKRHMLKNDTELEINRFGFGFSYLFY